MVKKSKDKISDVLGRRNIDEEEEDDPFVSKLNVTEEETNRPEIDINHYWTSLEESKKAFEDKGLSLGAVNAEKRISAEKPYCQNTPAENFFRLVDTTKGDIEARVDTMIRRKAVQRYLDSNKREKTRILEFLTYHLRLEGTDWLGNNIKCGIESEGIATEPRLMSKVIVDYKTGRQQVENRLVGTQEKMYIPYSKATVEKILKKFKTDPSTVKYYVFVPVSNNQATLKFKYGDLNYKEFSELPFESLTDLAQKRKDNYYKSLPPSLAQKGIM